MTYERFSGVPGSLCSRVLPADVDSFRALQNKVFPIKYEQWFYDACVSGKYESLLIKVPIAARNCGKEDERGDEGGEEKNSNADEAPLRYTVIAGVSARCRPADYGYGCKKGWTSYIATLAVDPSYRRRGLGTFLLKAIGAICELRCPLLREMTLHVDSANTAAIHMYEKQGFSRRGLLQKHYHFDGAFHDALLLVKPVLPLNDEPPPSSSYCSIL
jgi:ribosomal protein S18 acetylase RimI-like enzyme